MRRTLANRIRHVSALALASTISFASLAALAPAAHAAGIPRTVYNDAGAWIFASSGDLQLWAVDHPDGAPLDSVWTDPGANCTAAYNPLAKLVRGTPVHSGPCVIHAQPTSTAFESPPTGT